MGQIIRGKAFVLGDNVDTDQIIPARHLVYSLSDPEERKKYGQFALSGVPLDQSGLPQGGVPFVPPGKETSDFQIVVAGKNFGCGSSREHAHFALQMAGVRAVIANFYARIFYRNAVDGGFLIPFETDEDLVSRIHTGDVLEIDQENSLVRNVTRGETYRLKPLGEVAGIVEAGGIFAYARKAGMM